MLSAEKTTRSRHTRSSDSETVASEVELKDRQKSASKLLAPAYFRGHSTALKCVSLLSGVVATVLIYSVFTAVSVDLQHLFFLGRSRHWQRRVELGEWLRGTQSALRAVGTLRKGWLPHWFTRALSRLPRVESQLPSAFATTEPLPEALEFGSRIDLSDIQYRDWRTALPMQIAMYSGLALLSSAVCRALRCESLKLSTGNRTRAMVWFYAVFGAVFSLLLHGTNVIVLWLLLVINYWISRLPTLVGEGSSHRPLAASICVALTWIFNLLTALMCSLSTDRRLFSVVFWQKAFGLTRVLPFVIADTSLIPGLKLDWTSLQRMMLLKLVSFNLDRLFTLNAVNTVNNDESGGFQRRLRALYRSEFELRQLDARSNDFDFVSYFAFCFYAPLYFAGPILSFHDFMSQIKRKCAKSQSASFWIVARYALRFLASFLWLEVSLHFVYMALMKRALFGNVKWLQSLCGALESGSGSDVGIWALAVPFYLHAHVCLFVYLKFNTLWKFYRLAALIDGIGTVENMQRCVCHPLNVAQFWRTWHASFYCWNVRYLRIPLSAPRKSGGLSLRKVLTILLVFAFTTLWHGDFHLSLVGWGLIMVVCMLLEITGARIADALGLFAKSHWLSKALTTVAVVWSIVVLIVANNVGFGAGLWPTFRLLKAHTQAFVTAAHFGLVATTLLLHAAYFSAQYYLLDVAWNHSHFPTQNIWNK